MNKLDNYDNIWIDLTDFIDWKGHFTGIQRVEYELASRFKHLPNVKFFYYNPAKNSFIETNFEQIEYKAQIASGKLKLSNKELEDQIKLSQKLYNKLKASVPHSAKVTIKKLHKDYISKNVQIADLSHPFKQNELLLILGGNWTFKNFMKSIRTAKLNTKGLKSVHVLYDLIPVEHPGFFPKEMEKNFSKYMKEVLSIADLSLSISENTKIDALNYSKENDINPGKIVPFRLGDDFLRLNKVKPSVKRIEKDKFMLCLGTFEIRKNHLELYYALKLAKQKNIELPLLVIVGKKGWLSDSVLHLLTYDKDVKNKVVILNKASDKEVAWLYENCHFSVYPSLYEGWGLPISESLSYGSYCIASNTSSMPEVAGELIDYFSPYDPSNLLDTMKKCARTPASELRAKAKKYKTTSWDQTWQQACEIINQEV